MPTSWLSPLLYGVVLVAGTYAGLAGLGDTRPIPFAAGLLALVLVDLAERRQGQGRRQGWRRRGRERRGRGRRLGVGRRQGRERRGGERRGGERWGGERWGSERWLGSERGLGGERWLGGEHGQGRERRELSYPSGRIKTGVPWGASFGMPWIVRVRAVKGVPIAVMVVRVALFALVAWADGSGMARVLFLLVPFTAYFAFGRAVAVWLAVSCAGVLLASLHTTTPGWWRDVEHVSDLLMFTIGLVLALAMAAVVVEERRRHAELSAADERNSIARDVHDGLGHHLTAVAVLLEKAEAFRPLDPAVADRAVADARESARRALADVRRSVRTLHEEPFRLLPALQDLTHGLKIGLECAGDESAYEPQALRTLYRAAQEGITNALKHAEASDIDIKVHCGHEKAELTVRDNGIGFTEDNEGFGLRGMRERIAERGGSMDIRSDTNGTTLTVTVPR